MSKKHKSGGQALIMLTMLLMAMCGMMGLAVDLGWSYFVKKQAQSVADAAAMSAVRDAVSRVTSFSGFTCSSGMTNNQAYCQDTPINCGTVLAAPGPPPTYLNLYNGCRYAQANGFTTGGAGGRQNVTIQANEVKSPGRLPPTAPGVNGLIYWVTVRAVQTIPQLFSAVLGNAEGTVAARATAAIATVVTPGSVHALNREGDCNITNFCGTDIKMSGGGTIIAPNGVRMASQCNASLATGCQGQAGESNNNSRICLNTNSTPCAPTTIRVRLDGTVTPPGTAAGNPFAGWSNQYANGSEFEDPTQKMNQPPLTATGANGLVSSCGVPNGQITDGTWGPYNYYAYSQNGNNFTLTGAPIVINGTNTGTVKFSRNGGGCNCVGCKFTQGVDQGNSIPTPSYMFYGGMTVNNSSHLVFDQGQYVMIGAQQTQQGNANAVFDSGGGGTTMTSNGQSVMFLFTNVDYPGIGGQGGQINAPAMSGHNLSEVVSTTQLYQGFVNVKAGNSSALNLKGIDSTVNTDLPEHNGVLFWMDRRNSTVKYNLTNGVYNCTGPSYTTGCVKSSGELSADRVLPGSNHFTLNATQNFSGLDGVLYQPRGAYFSMQGNGNFSGGLRVIAGAFDLGGNGDILLTNPVLNFYTFVASLIE